MTLDRPSEWFEDEQFWCEFYTFMFPEGRFESADGEVDAVLALTKPTGRDVLDLCCGPGRSAIPLALRGYNVTGVDRTRFLLEKAHARAQRAGVAIEWVRQDMREFVRPGRYDLVLSLFTSFGYFNDKCEDGAVLRNIHESLKPGGVCLIDVVGKEFLARIFQPTRSEALEDGSLFVGRHEIFDDWTRIRNEWLLIKDTGVFRYEFHHTIYSGQELKDRMMEAGIGEVRLYGSWAGCEYGLNAERLIAVGRKSP